MCSTAGNHSKVHCPWKQNTGWGEISTIDEQTETSCTEVAVLKYREVLRPAGSP